MQHIGILRVQCRILLLCTRTSPTALFARLRSSNLTKNNDVAVLPVSQEEDKLDLITMKLTRNVKIREKPKRYRTSIAKTVTNGSKNTAEKNVNKIHSDENNEHGENKLLSSVQLKLRLSTAQNLVNNVIDGNTNNNNNNVKIGVKCPGEKRLREKVQLLLDEAFSATKSKKDLGELEIKLRQEETPSFETLLHACAWASKSSQSEVILRLLDLTHLLYPKECEENLGLKYYLASSLCYGGQVEEGLLELRILYRQHPQPHKKLRDTTNFIIYHLASTGREEHEEMVLNFVNCVAEEVGELSPALTLWRATFCSPTYKLQLMSEDLLKRHPGLMKKMERKVPGLLARATWEGDEETLRRLLQLLLRYQLTQHYHTAITALLKLQCDLGDLSGAEETLKFSQRVRVILPPTAVARMLSLLAHHCRPAPLALLALKYRPVPPRPTIPRPPKFKYKF